MDFIEWGVCYSGIYYDQKTKKYSTILSDLRDITFDCIGDAREWLKDYHGVAHMDNNELEESNEKPTDSDSYTDIIDT